MRFRAFFVPLVSGVLFAAAQGQLSKSESDSLQAALSVGNMQLGDLSYDRKTPTDKYLLPLVKLGIRRPIDAANSLLALHNSAISKSGSALLGEANESLFGEAPKVAKAPPANIVFPTGFPPEFAQSLAKLIMGIQDANATIRAATSKLSPAERRELIEGLPALACEGAVKVAFIKKDFPNRARLLSLLERVDLAQIRAAGVNLAAIVETETPVLRKLKAQYKFDGVFKSKLGGLTVELSGKDSYTFASTDASLGIALGPRAHVTGRYGAGVGYGSVFIDLSAESTYETPDASIGVGILGAGVHYLAGSKHVLRGKSICFGAGLAGVGVVLADAGQNSFEAVSMAEGFGMFGIGMVQCKGGDNSMRVRAWGQGAARSGGLGWLSIQSGRNSLRAGQLVQAPQGGGYQAFAQGFSAGYGEALGGGVGMLTLNGGEDQLHADALSQGAGIDGGLGSMLLAGKGSDLWAQGEAMGFGSEGAGYAFLLGSGFSQTLASTGGLGYGNQDGVGFQLSRGSHNLYASGEGRLGSAGSSGAGVFLQNGDDNRFLAAVGVCDPSPESASIGVFSAMGAGNQFLAGLADGQVAVQTPGGISVAGETLLATGDPASLPPVGSKPFASETEAADLLPRLAQNRGRFVASGKTGLLYLLQKGLSSLDDRGLAELAFLVRANGADGAAMLADALKGAEPATQGRLWRVAELSQCKSVGGLVAEALKNDAAKEAAARAAGPCAATGSSDALIALCASENRAIARAALTSLAQLGDEKAVGTAQALALSEELPIRRAALALLSRFPSSALAYAKNLTSTADARSRAIGLQLCKAAGSPEALELAAGFLKDANPAIRIQAGLALNAQCPAKHRASLQDLRRDQNPLVRQVAARLTW